MFLISTFLIPASDTAFADFSVINSFAWTMISPVAGSQISFNEVRPTSLSTNGTITLPSAVLINSDTSNPLSV